MGAFRHRNAKLGLKPQILTKNQSRNQTNQSRRPNERSPVNISYCKSKTSVTKVSTYIVQNHIENLSENQHQNRSFRNIFKIIFSLKRKALDNFVQEKNQEYKTKQV